MVSAQELANLMVSEFNPKRSEKLTVVLVELLRTHGVGRFQSEMLADQYRGSVLEILRRRRLEDLPFVFSQTDPERLIGKERQRPSDTPKTIRVRQARRYISDILQAIFAGGADGFEILCAACMKLSGAREVFTTCSSDDGGIDIFGRLAIRPPDVSVPTGLLQTTLLNREVLMLGQCKCYHPGSKIGPGEIQKFQGAVRDCLSNYEGNPHPPVHRVPDGYYRRNELCIPIFMTTASYSLKATGAAEANEIVPIFGRSIAEFIAYQGIGFLQEGSDYIFDKEAFNRWLDKQRFDYQGSIGPN